MLDAADVYHTGFVVPEIEPAMAELTAVFGVTWTDVEEREMPIVTPEGPRVVTLRFAYTRGTTHLIELLEPVAGTAWEVPSHSFGGGAAHHVGVWAEDFVATSEKLAASGFPRVLTFDDWSGQAARFAYHRLASGAIVELIDATRRTELEAWFQGADYPAAQAD